MAKPTLANPSMVDIVAISLAMGFGLVIMGKFIKPSDTLAAPALGTSAGKDPKTGLPLVPRTTTFQWQNSDFDGYLRQGSGMNVTWRFTHIGPRGFYVVGMELSGAGIPPFSFFGQRGPVSQRIETDIEVDDDPILWSYAPRKTEIFQGGPGFYDAKLYIRNAGGVILSERDYLGAIAVSP